MLSFFGFQTKSLEQELKQENDTLKQENDTLKQEIETLKQKNETLKQENETLNNNIKKAERIQEIKDYDCFFNRVILPRK